MKKRADILLVEQGACVTRTEAQKLIMAGQVRRGADQVVDKPGAMFEDGTALTLVAPLPYVSRGALKLKAALDRFKPEIAGLTALDVGASTGGFTDLLLQSGVRRVYAVDVGYGQLHGRLRADPRVVCLERVNARHLDASLVPEPIGIMVADVSFISLRLVLPPCVPLLAPGAWIFALVKPQFEAGRDQVGKGGVVRDPAVREQCVEGICAFAQQNLGFRLVGVEPSPITGPKGNQKYITAFRASGE